RRSRALSLAQEVNDVAMEAEILLGAARDAYQTAVQAVDAPHGEAAFHAAHDATRRALDAALGAESLHTQAQALGLLAACDLGLGDLAAALDEAHRAIEMHVA